MQKSRQLRRAKLAEEIARKRRLLYAMKIVTQDKLPTGLRERHASLIQEMTEELQKMEVEFHELNVQQIREELKGGRSDL
jgi:hypothetical protein